jgi:hypothetical protein
MEIEMGVMGSSETDQFWARLNQRTSNVSSVTHMDLLPTNPYLAYTPKSDGSHN